MRFGGAEFVGQVSGNRVRLVRRSEHEYEGKWLVTETIDARFVVTTGTLARLLQDLKAALGGYA